MIRSMGLSETAYSTRPPPIQQPTVAYVAPQRQEDPRQVEAARKRMEEARIAIEIAQRNMSRSQLRKHQKSIRKGGKLLLRHLGSTKTRSPWGPLYVGLIALELVVGVVVQLALMGMINVGRVSWLGG